MNFLDDHKYVNLTGVNAFDRLCYLYENLTLDDGYDAEHYHFYETLCDGELKFALKEGAVPPTKVRASDTGYDITVISCEQKQHGVVMYDTGVSFQAPDGYYLDVVPRSSLYKQGYFLVNSIGIIDNSYRGTVRLCLAKLNPDVPDLQLPFRAAQVIVRKLHHMTLKEATLNETDRGVQGFGST